MGTLERECARIINGNRLFGSRSEETANDIIEAVIARTQLVARRLCRDDGLDWDRLSLTHAGDYMDRATAYVGALLEDDANDPA